MLEQIKSIVKSAGRIMLEAHLVRDGVESKEGRANFVTKYDVEVQNYLYKELSKEFPTASFIGEEDKQKEKVSGDFCFIIDPIDGTTNFIFDYRHSAISVGLMDKNKMVAGVVYNPYLDELFAAEKGKGASLNSRLLKLKDIKLSDGIIAFGTCPYNRDMAEDTFRLARRLYDKALDVRRSGSAALDICYVAAGRLALYYEMILQPWDYAAGSLILAEAGGCISTMEGTEIPVTRPCSVIAASPASYKDYYSLVKEKNE